MREERSTTMISQGKGIEKTVEEETYRIPGSLIDVKATPNLKEFSLIYIEDSLNLMTGTIERVLSIIGKLASDAEGIFEAAKLGYSYEKAVQKRDDLVCDSSLYLPLVETQLDALKITGSFLAQGIRQMRETHPVPVEKRSA